MVITSSTSPKELGVFFFFFTLLLYFPVTTFGTAEYNRGLRCPIRLIFLLETSSDLSTERYKKLQYLNQTM